MADYSKSLINSLIKNVKEYPRFSKQEIAKIISKNIRDQIKKINVSINGETLRVASKSKNDLQLAIKLVSELEESLNIPLKANNFR